MLIDSPRSCGVDDSIEDLLFDLLAIEELREFAAAVVDLSGVMFGVDAARDETREDAVVLMSTFYDVILHFVAIGAGRNFECFDFRKVVCRNTIEDRACNRATDRKQFVASVEEVLDWLHPVCELTFVAHSDYDSRR